MFQRSPLRYAHTTGYTNLIYTDDGEYIVTCGTDGDIRKWRSIDDDDPTSNCLGEFVICIAHSKGRLLASTDRNTIQAYTFPDIDQDGTLMRFTASVNCMRLHEKYFAAGSEDMMIKVLKGTDIQSSFELQGHKGPLLALDICAKGQLLASMAGDGNLKVWDLETAKEVKSIGGLIKANSFENAKCFGSPRFEPVRSDSLAYAKEKEIIVLNASTWEVRFTLSDENVQGDYTCCEFSHDGRFLAAGTTNGELSVFDFVRKEALRCEEASTNDECQAITSIAWNPKGKELAYCDATGQLGTLFYDKSAPKRGESAFMDTEAEQVDFGGMDFENDGADDDAADNGFDDDGDDDDDGVSIEKLKSRIMKSAVEQAADEDSRDSMAKSAHDSETTETARQFYPKLFKRQSPFQPSSTPADLEHRYLVWNDVGIVASHADSADGSIDVEFHDASIHHSLHISNYNNHNMASISATVLALSAEGSMKLVCIALAASGNREWSVQMPDCEAIEALAVTEKLVAVATNMHFVRLFTVMGTQREILSIPGPVLAMAGHGDRIIVCYHSAAPNESQQHLSALLLHINGLPLRTQHLAMPLPAGRQLSWLGFSDCGSPVFADSMGLLQLFSPKSNCWHPICDTMKQSQSVSNHYFIIAVSERSQIVQAILCRGASYPMTNPRPMVQELEMHLPVCDTEIEKSELEDAFIRATIMNADHADKTVKETAIKLFALACRSEMEMRAKELIEMIACPELLMLAVKYATKLGRIHLSDRLSELMPDLEEKSQREKQEQALEKQQQKNALNSLLLSVASPSSGGNAAQATILAPKSMDLSLLKHRSSLKRFSISNTPPARSFNKKTINQSSAGEEDISSPSVSTLSNLDTQENMPTRSEEKEMEEMPSGEEQKNLPRTPLNSVNPFASKRKLSDVDFIPKGGVLIDSGKLKMAKK